jgi:hypothetical protein
LRDKFLRYDPNIIFSIKIPIARFKVQIAVLLKIFINNRNMLIVVLNGAPVIIISKKPEGIISLLENCA